MEQTTDVHDIMDVSQKYYYKTKKPNPREYTPYDSTYMKSKPICGDRNENSVYLWG